MKKAYITGILASTITALMVAWGAHSYYGERRMGQYSLVPPAAEILSYADFAWPLQRESEVILDPNHIGNPAFVNGRFRFTTVEDTYFSLNTAGQQIVANYHFVLVLQGSAHENGTVRITLSRNQNAGVERIVSEEVALPAGGFRQNIDLRSLSFFRDGDIQQPVIWGADVMWADGLRLDFDGYEPGSAISLFRVLLQSGVAYTFDIRAQQNELQVDNINVTRLGLKLERRIKTGSAVTPPVGVGTIRRYHDVLLNDSFGDIAVEARSGRKHADGSWTWQPWQQLGSDGSLAGLPSLPWLQLRFTLSRTAGEDGPWLGGYTIRVIDPSPPGLGGPLFGTSHIPTYLPERNINELLSASANTIWLRLPYHLGDLERRISELIAEDINVMVSANLDVVPRDRLLETVRLNRSRVLVWELWGDVDQGAQFYIELYNEIHQYNPAAIIFPERIGNDYFQNLAARGLFQAAEDHKTQEEILDRGFWFYFIVIFIAVLVIIALAPILGYNFHLGFNELRLMAITLAVTAALALPLMLLIGFAEFTLPRDWMQIQIAFSRFILSAVFQEFLRALMLLLSTHYLIKLNMDEARAWWLSIGASSVLFGLTHLGYPGFSSYEVFGFILVTTIVGLTFGWLFMRTRSITAISIVHLLSNVFFSTMTNIGPRM